VVMTAGRKSRRRSRRGWASLLALVVLVAAAAARGLAADGLVFAGACGQPVATVQTNQSSYPPGRPVIVTVTEVNDGPACVTPPLTCGLPTADASAYNSAGDDVWDDYASKVMPGFATCPAEFAPGQTWTAYYSQTSKFDWSQDTCALDRGRLDPETTNPDCPGTQVPAGTYRIVGSYWNYWRSSNTAPSASATIIISG
jgi:hypothetical protein